MWLQAVAAVGTAVAALFAGWAAWIARRSAEASRDLVKLELERDLRSAEEARWRQARRVTVDLMGQEVFLPPDNTPAHDMYLVVLNGSTDPISKVRLKIVGGDAVWGPQLVGNVAPGNQVTLIARLITSRDTDNADAFVRFVDIEGRPWVANARTSVGPDESGIDTWIAEGRAFGERNLTAAERGTISGAVGPPDLESWRQEVDSEPDWRPAE
jgi:hypothetical protein